MAFVFLTLTVTGDNSGSPPVDPFAQNALTTIESDLQQEIVDGSSATTYNANGTQSTVYYPKPSSPTSNPPATSTMTPAIVGFTPFISGVGQETDGLANLLKVSEHGLPFHPLNSANHNYADPAPQLMSGRVANVNSSVPALDGHLISTDRWNEHLLLARKHSGAGTDLTPVTSFPSPDWVVVAKDGNNPTGWDQSLVANGTNQVTGRYAYAIYNEGGLLDMNVAGYPSTLSPAKSSYKTYEAFADLTQLNAPNPMTSQQIDQIVGWRNAASSQVSGFFPNYVFTSTAANNYYNAVLSNTTGFLTPSTVTYNGQTDQQFTNRQQLIALAQTLGINLDVLQYLGTFTRSLEQPSYAPDPQRPNVIWPTIPPPSTSQASSYMGNNDAAGGDTIINPAFLSIRVATPFMRWNGNLTVSGDPLVMTKFPLSRLKMVAYNATNQTAKTVYQTASDPDPILDRFGLTRVDPSAPWVYNHGRSYIMSLSQVAALTGSNAREPDFAELLKAAITTGSLAKGAPNLLSTSANPTINLQYVNDTSTDLQVLQIMANLIDQQDSDSYPTRIQLGTGGAPTSAVNSIVCGVEDLPYIYRYHTVGVVDRLPNPLFHNTTDSAILPPIPHGVTVTVHPTGPSVETPSVTPWLMTNPINSGIPGWGGGFVTPGLPFTFYGAGQGTLADPGEATYLLVTDLWNPHDPSSLANENISKRPTHFRVSAATIDPYYDRNNNPNSSRPWTIVTVGLVNPNTPPLFYGDTSFFTFDRRAALIVQSAPVSSVMLTSPLTEGSPNTGNTAITISDFSGGNAFREPTLIWHDAPGLFALTGPTSPSNQLPTVIPPPIGGPRGMPANGLPDPVNNGPNYFGFVLGQIPLSVNLNLTGAVNPGVFPPPAVPPEYQNMDYIFQAKGFSRYDPGALTLPDTEVISGYGAVNYPQNYPTSAAIPVGANAQITLMLEYQDANGNWIPYDYKYPDLSGMAGPSLVVSKSDFPQASPPNRPNTWGNMQQMQPGTDSTTFLPMSQVSNHAINVDPRTGRWGMAKWGLGQFPYTSTLNGGNRPIDTNPALDDPSNSGGIFSIINSLEPGGDKGFWAKLAKPGDAGTATNMRWFNVSNFYDGMMAFNNPALRITVNGSSNTQQFYEDADGIARRAMGAYASIPNLDASSGQPLSGTAPGMPLATANTYGAPGVAGIATQQSQSRPFILNRSFKSVAEMSYAFTGTPWKNIDFFTPESGDVALLDTFCLNETPTVGMVAGKVDLNTRQEPVLQAILAGAYRDEAKNATSPPVYALPALTTAEATNVAEALFKYTTFTPTSAIGWRGPLANVSELVGKYVNNPGSAISSVNPAPSLAAPDAYSYVSQNGQSAGNGRPLNTYAGFSASLGSNVFTPGAAGSSTVATSTTSIQRMREAAIRPLVDCGQTRVWNLLIDVVAQTGGYPASATDFTQFSVTGERHYWQHVAIDRFTGQILDQSIEEVAEAADDIVASNLVVQPNTAAGSTIGTLNALPGSGFTFSLVSGAGSDDNALFTITGNVLQAAATLGSPASGSYNIRVQAMAADGSTYQQTLSLVMAAPTDTPTMPLWALASFAALLFFVTARFLAGKRLVTV